ncbi:MAG TPA: acetate--CoA ligase family protein, partial [Frankiaceae bacterium]|nr:acetate--CoA ligase family protein [Frankiaceae bacterium]
MTAYGIPVAPLVTVDTAEAAAAATRQLGTPVAVKAEGQDLVHKSDVGGVRLGLGSAAEAARAYREMATRLAGRMTGAVVQSMVPAGVEVVVGVAHDPAFGPLVMFGLGGVTTDLLDDHAFRALPLTDVDAAELVRSVRAAPLLFGYRGAPTVDVAAVEDLVLRVA